MGSVGRSSLWNDAEWALFTPASRSEAPEMDSEGKIWSLTRLCSHFGSESSTGPQVQRSAGETASWLGVPSECSRIAAGCVGPWLSNLWWENSITAVGTGEIERKTRNLEEESEHQKGPQMSKFCNYASLYSRNVIHVFFPLNVRWDAVHTFVELGLLLQQGSTRLNFHHLPWVILNEVTRCKAYGVPLSCALQSEKRALSELHGTMHPMLRTMVTGHIIGFLNVWLLGYLSGGTYNEQTILHYPTSKDASLLQKGLVDPRKELLSVKKALQAKGESVEHLPARYICLSDILEEAVEEGMATDDWLTHYCSTFRLRGTLLSVQQSKGVILEPECGVLVESDVHVEPGLGLEISKNLLDGAPEPMPHSVYIKTVSSMKREIEENMSRHPRYAPYFELLKIISFCAALADAMCSAGASPTGGPAPDENRTGDAECKFLPFPMVFPPLPVRRGPIVQIEISFDDVARTVCNMGKQWTVNKMIRDDVSGLSMEDRTKCLLAVSSETTLKAVKAQVPQAEAIVDLDDGTLQVSKVASGFRHFLQKLVCLAIASKVIGIMKGMCHIFANNSTPIFDPKEIDERYVENYEGYRKLISYAKNVFLKKWWSNVETEVERQRLEAVKTVEAHMKSRPDIEASTRQEVEDKITEQIDQALSQLREKLQREAESSMRGRNYASNDIRQKTIQTTMNRELKKAKDSMERDAERKKDRIIRDNVNKRMDSMRTAVNEAKREIEKNARDALKKIRDASKDLQQEITNSLIYMEKDPLGSYLKLNMGFSCTLLKTRFKLGFADIPLDTDISWGIQSFCELTNSEAMVEKNSALLQRHQNFCSEKVIIGGCRLNNIQNPFFQLDVSFEHFTGSTDELQGIFSSKICMGDRLVYERQRSLIRGEILDDSASLEDSFGMHLGHYIGCSPLTLNNDAVKRIPKPLLSRPGVDGLLPLHYACMSGNREAVRELLSLDRSSPSLPKTSISPLLLACQMNHHDIAVQLLQQSPEGVNSCTLTKVTPLHWAVYHRNSKLVRELVARGSMVAQGREFDGLTPVHLAARAGALDCLESLLLGHAEYGWLKSKDHRTPLHEACRGNNSDCAILLLSVMNQDEKLKAIELEDKGSFSPLTLCVFLGHQRLAVLLCQAANIQSLGFLMRNLPREKKKHFEKMIMELPMLSGQLNVSAGPESPAVPNNAEPARRRRFSREHIMECGFNSDRREGLLQECIYSRNSASLKQLALHGSLSTRETKAILLAVSNFGLLDWPATLSNCGIDVCTENIDGRGHDLLFLSAKMDDEALLKAVWTEYARFNAKPTHFSHLVKALIAVPMHSTKVWEALAGLFQSVEASPSVGEADALLEDALTTVVKWNFARHFRLQPSEEGMVRAAGRCRPTVLQCLLSEGSGLLEEVQIRMLQEALLHNRKDNALTIIRNSWPNFELCRRKSNISPLLESVQKLIERENLREFKKDVRVQEEVLQCPLRLQEVNATDGKSFFDKLAARQFLPMENRLFGVYAWLLANSTEKFKCPWDADIEDERGMNGYVCCCGSICGSPTNILKISASIGVSAEDLLLHPSFTTSMKMCSSPVPVMQKILETCHSRTAIAACLSSLAQLEERSVNTWTSLVESVPSFQEELPFILDTVVDTADQLTLLMRLIPLPEASELISSAFKSFTIRTALEKRDRNGRSPAHHLLSFCLPQRRVEHLGLTESMNSILASRLRCVLSILPILLHQEDRDGNTLFILAAKCNNTPALTVLSTFAPIPILDRSVVHREGWHALHMATAMNCTEAVKSLILEFGINPNQRTAATFESQGTPRCISALHIAARKSNAVLFRLLVQLGGDPLLTDGGGDTPLHWAIRYGDDTLYRYVQTLPGFWILNVSGALLVSAASNGSLSPFYLLTLLKMVHPNRACRSRRQRTAFLEAAREGNLKTIHAFARMGADLISFDADRWNSLHFAAIRGSTAMLAEILRYITSCYSSREVESALTQCNANGDSALHFAAQSGCLGGVLILLSFPCVRHCCVLQQNNKGLTPANVAVISGHSDVAVTLLEAGGERAVLEAVNPMDSAVLTAFWNSVPAETKNRAKERLLTIKPLCLSTHEVSRTFSQESEQKWETLKNLYNQKFISLLPHESGLEVLDQLAFASDVVRCILVDNLQKNEECYNATVTMIKWCGSSGLPNHAICFCIQKILIWEPEILWTSITSFFSSTLEWWRTEEDTYPGEQHVVWEWIRLLFGRKEIGVCLDKETLSLITIFFAFFKNGLENYLPPPQVPIGVFSEKNYCSSTKLHLEIVNEALRQINTDDERRLAASYFNTFWSRCFDTTRTKSSPGSNFGILEAQVFDIFGVRALKSLQFLSNEPLDEGSLFFILRKMVDAPQNTTDTDLMSWATTSATTIAAVGLHLPKKVFQSLSAKINSFHQKLLSSHYLHLQFFTDLMRGMNEIDFEDDLMSCIDLSTENCSSVKDYRDAVSASLKQKISKLRTLKLGVDRTIEELISSFQSTDTQKLVHEPHLFLFDGTPSVSLSPSELNFLSQTIRLSESKSARISLLSVSQIKDEAHEAGLRMKTKPNMEDLARIISLVREGFFRTMQKRPFRVQCMCLAAFIAPLCLSEKPNESFKGRLAQVATGEGKSIIVSMVAATCALFGQPVDVITSSGVLAARDATEFEQFYRFFGLKCSHISVDSPTRANFNADVVYGTNTDFEFALLREGCFCESLCVYDPLGSNSWKRRPRTVAVVDEADNLFLDAAQNSARIAYSTRMCFTWVYAPIYELVSQCSTPPGASTVRTKLSEIQNGYYAKMTEMLVDSQLEGWVRAALVALHHHKRDKEYIVRQQRVIIVDLDTGRLQESSRWGHGVHEMIEVKEGVPVQPESGVIGSIAHPSFFDGYSMVLGITGTAGEPEERDEVQYLYGIDTFDVPPHRPCLRKRFPTLIYKTKTEKYSSIAQSAFEKRKTTSVLILLPTISESNKMINLLRSIQRNVPCLLLNETQRENEDFVLLKASQLGTILVATNTAGRGTDIRPSTRVLENGGLHVIYGAFPPNLRVECQGLGRSARQGQPGSSQIFIALDEDFVMQILGASHPFRSNGMEECVQQLYSARTANIRKESLRRARTTALERVYFNCFQHFAEDQRWLKESILTVNNSETLSTVRSFVASSTSIRINAEEMLQRLCECFRILWVCYYTAMTDKRKTSSDIDVSKIYCDNVVHKDAIFFYGSTLYQSFLTTNRWQLSQYVSCPSISDAVQSVISSHLDLLEKMETTTTTDYNKKTVNHLF